MSPKSKTNGGDQKYNSNNICVTGARVESYKYIYNK